MALNAPLLLLVFMPNTLNLPEESKSADLVSDNFRSSIDLSRVYQSREAGNREDWKTNTKRILKGGMWGWIGRRVSRRGVSELE
ncbi:MAG: hypothetical protein J3Q66DRAFT_164152 [Benniella sp.]|nr:MAG: hypothetical protein J3Q66DRAFT_164152 [Benniella sp.]